jgi:iron complex transport system substrate-binding protein
MEQIPSEKELTMHRSKALTFLLFSLLMLTAGLFGCSQPSNTSAALPTLGSTVVSSTTSALQATPVTVISTTASSASSTVAARTMKDDLGNQVTVPENPTKVLALTKNMMDEIYLLGVKPVGKVEEYNNEAALVALPSVSNQANPNLEAIYQLKPDLILANSRQHAQMLEGLKNSGAAVFMIDPNKLSDNPLTDEVVFLGKLLNRNAEAQAYVDRLNTLCKSLQTKLAPSGYKTGLFMMSGDAISVAQPTGVYGALLPSLGIKNIVPKGLPGSDKSTWVAFDAETIVKENPDVILIKASSNEDQANQKILTAFKQNLAWKDLNAVKNNNVFIIPARIAPGNMSMESILESTAKIIYPGGAKN